MHVRAHQKLTDIFPGQVAITPQQTGFALGYARQSTNNMLHLKTFPIPLVQIGNRRMVLIDDLQKYLDEIRQLQQKRRPGRPTKAEQIARGEVSHG